MTPIAVGSSSGARVRSQRLVPGGFEGRGHGRHRRRSRLAWAQPGSSGSARRDFPNAGRVGAARSAIILASEGDSVSGGPTLCGTSWTPPVRGPGGCRRSDSAPPGVGLTHSSLGETAARTAAAPHGSRQGKKSMHETTTDAARPGCPWLAHASPGGRGRVSAVTGQAHLGPATDAARPGCPRGRLMLLQADVAGGQQ